MAGKAQASSRLSSGRDVLPDVDGRSVVARNRDIIGAVVSDQGGAEHLSEARLQLIRRFSAAAVMAEEMEGRLARGEPIDISEHALLCSSLVRLVARFGINRRTLEIVPGLASYLDQDDNPE
jgi:hypothetical protein